MNILETLVKLRDDIKTWVANNLNALNAKIDEKTIPIDSELDSESVNPVQNQVIAKEIDSINNRVGNTSVAAQISKAINAQEHFSGDYNDLTNAPNISENDDGTLIIADESGNVIFKVDAEGAHTTDLTLNGESVNSIIDTRVAALVDSAPGTLDTLNELAAALGDDPNFATTIATEIGNKVNKEDGKGLSTNDFTNEYKTKLDSLENITFEETDPTVPAWAKAENPPTYTAEDVGALPSNTPLFSGDYYDLENAPNITEDHEGNLVIADADGNIVFRSDENGFETTNLVAQTITLNGSDLIALIKAEVKTYVDTYILGGEW